MAVDRLRMGSSDSTVGTKGLADIPSGGNPAAARFAARLAARLMAFFSRLPSTK